MALNGDTLGDAIKAAIDGLDPEDKTDRTQLFRAMGAAIVAHIQGSAVVSVNVTTTGNSTNQAGSGTGTIA